MANFPSADGDGDSAAALTADLTDNKIPRFDSTGNKFVDSSVVETTTTINVNKDIQFNKNTKVKAGSLQVGESITLKDSGSALVIEDFTGKKFSIAQRLLPKAGGPDPVFVPRLSSNEVIVVEQSSDVQTQVVSAVSWNEIQVDDFITNEFIFRATTATTGLRLVVRENNASGRIISITAEDDPWNAGDGFTLAASGDTTVVLDSSIPHFDGAIVHITLEVATGTFGIKGDTVAFGGQPSAFVPYFAEKIQKFKLPLLADGGGFNTVLTGDVAITAGTNTVNGTSTLFNSELVLGQAVQIREESFTVATITSDVLFTLSANHVVGAGSGIGGGKNAKVFAENDLLTVKTFNSSTRMSVDKTGKVFIDQTTNNAALDINTTSTTASALEINGDSLTTGGLAILNSNSADTSARNLVRIVNDNSLSTGTKVLEVSQDAAQVAIDLTGLGGGSIQMAEIAAVPGGAPAATKGKYWVRNDAPNVPMFTDDAGTDFILSGGGLSKKGVVTTDADDGEGIYTLDAVGGSFDFTLPAATGSQDRRLLLGDNVAGANNATIKVQAGEDLNGNTDGSFILNVNGQVLLATDRVTGKWDLAVVGAASGTTLEVFNISSASITAPGTGNPWDLGSTDFVQGGITYSAGIATISKAGNYRLFWSFGDDDTSIASVVGAFFVNSVEVGVRTRYGADGFTGGGSVEHMQALAASDTVEFRQLGSAGDVESSSMSIQEIPTSTVVNAGALEVITIERVAMSPTSGQTLTNGTDITWSTVTAFGFSIVNDGTLFTLTANKTYRLSAGIKVSAQTSGEFLELSWVDNANADVGIGGHAITFGMPDTAAENSQNTAHVMFTPSVDTQVKLRATGGSVTVDIQGSRSWGLIEEVPSSTILDTGTPTASGSFTETLGGTVNDSFTFSITDFPTTNKGGAFEILIRPEDSASSSVVDNMRFFINAVGAAGGGGAKLNPVMRTRNALAVLDDTVLQYNHTFATVLQFTLTRTIAGTSGLVNVKINSLDRADVTLPTSATTGTQTPDTTFRDHIQPFVGATGSLEGSVGFVTKPAATDNTKFLKGDGTWAITDPFDRATAEITADTTVVNTVSPGDSLLSASVTIPAGVTGAEVEVIFTATPTNNDGKDTDMFFVLKVDGVVVKGAGQGKLSNSLPASAISISASVPKAAGTYTAEVFWYVSGGTGEIKPVTRPDQDHATLIVRAVNG